MTDEKITEVLDFYEKCTAGHESVEHLHGMIPTMRLFLAEGRREKLMRWLGFMQGVFWALDIFTLEELMAHNKPDGAVFDGNA